MPTAPADRFTLAPRSATTKPPALKSSPTTQQILPKSSFSASSRSSPLPTLPLISSRLPSWFLRSQFRLQERLATRVSASHAAAVNLSVRVSLSMLVPPCARTCVLYVACLHPRQPYPRVKESKPLYR